MVLWMPYLRAQATICPASSPALTEPSPTSPSSLTPASASSLKSCSAIPFSMTGAPASTLTPPGRKLSKARCAVMARALRPTMSLGRPGRCTSPAEIMVVTPPCRVESIQPIWPWRGVQSPKTGCTWLSIRPGHTQVLRASITTSGAEVSQSDSLPTETIRPSFTTMVSASRTGRSMSPDSSRPMFLMTSLPDLPEATASAMDLLLQSGCPGESFHRRRGSRIMRPRRFGKGRSHAQRGFDHERFPMSNGLGRLDVFAEEGRQREPVGSMEISQPGDHQIEVARRQVAAEDALGGAAAEHPVDRADRGGRVLPRLRRLADVLAAVQVLGVEQRDELGIRPVVVQHEAHDLPQRFDRTLGIEVELGLRHVEAVVACLQHREVQALLVAEVVIDHPVVRLRRLGNLLDAPAREAMLGEDLGGRAQQAFARGLRGQFAHSRLAPRPGLGRGAACRGWIAAHVMSPLAEIVIAAPYCSANARSMTKSPGVEVLPSLKPLRSSRCLRSCSMPGLPQIITRSSSGLISGTPRSLKILPLSISSGMRPVLRNSSRVTVG